MNRIFVMIALALGLAFGAAAPSLADAGYKAPGYVIPAASMDHYQNASALFAHVHDGRCMGLIDALASYSDTAYRSREIRRTWMYARASRYAIATATAKRHRTPGDNYG